MKFSQIEYKRVDMDALKKELADLQAAILSGADLTADEALAKHADWVKELRGRHTFTEENTMDILLQETGRVFAAVLEDAGVYKCDLQGRARFMEFIRHVNAQ